MEKRERIEQKDSQILKVMSHDIEGYPKSHSLYVDVNHIIWGLKLAIIVDEMS